jgi:vacuolar-type H+-ATPase subunit F/Vma7
MQVAVIGDLELVSTLRLAGVRKTRAVQGEHDAAEQIREALKEYMSDPEVGVVMLLEEFAELARDTVSHYRQSKSVLPVIVEVPSKGGTRHPDVVGYYRQLSRQFLGFDIVL